MRAAGGPSRQPLPQDGSPTAALRGPFSSGESDPRPARAPAPAPAPHLAGSGPQQRQMAARRGRLRGWWWPPCRCRASAPLSGRHTERNRAQPFMYLIGRWVSVPQVLLPAPAGLFGLQPLAPRSARGALRERDTHTHASQSLPHLSRLTPARFPHAPHPLAFASSSLAALSGGSRWRRRAS